MKNISNIVDIQNVKVTLSTTSASVIDKTKLNKKLNVLGKY